jgi:hypothetical protein
LADVPVLAVHAAQVADTGLADEQQGAAVLEPAKALELADLGLGDRAPGGVVEVVEADADRQSGGRSAGC